MHLNRARIIGGQWRAGCCVSGCARAAAHTGPVRETVFNWLGQDLTGMSCLDLFAGSGALGSRPRRGSESGGFGERDRVAAQALQANVTTSMRRRWKWSAPMRWHSWRRIGAPMT
jgi:16S rRNA (guanine966-N2)-methyltransferase